MSRREPWQPELEDVLRRALHTEADSVEPGADGLDRIRMLIRAGRPLPGGWAMAGQAVSAGRGGLAWRHLRHARCAARDLWDAVLRPTGLGAGTFAWQRWLRPAATLATVVFVAVGGSWAIAALPRMIAPSGSSSPAGSSAGQAPARSSGPAGAHGTSQSPPGSLRHASSPAGQLRPTATSSGGPRSPGPSWPASSTPSANPSGSGMPSASPSPSASSTSSASPSPSASCTPAPSPSPTARGKHPREPRCRKQHHR